VALLYIDGFAHANLSRYASGASANFQTNGIASGALHNYYVFSAALGRAITAASEVFTGFRYSVSTYVVSNIVSVMGDAGATRHLTLNVNTSGLLELRRGTSASGTLLGTGTTVIGINVWHYIEMRATIADAGGVCQIRLDGVLEIDVTGDTKNAGTATSIDMVRLDSSNINQRCTDWYIANTAGSAPGNSWLGDTVVRTLVPTGDGALSQLVGSDGNSVSNWQQVDELPPSTTDYNGSPTTNAEDTYAITDLPSTNVTVYGVQLSSVLAKSDAGVASSTPLVRIGSTDYDSGAKTLTTSYAEYLDLYPASPATGVAWTPTEVNGAQIGMKVV
jgi:hypothetical protein